MGIPKKRTLIGCEIRKDDKVIHSEVVGYIFKEKIEKLRKTQEMYGKGLTDFDIKLEEVSSNKEEN